MNERPKTHDQNGIPLPFNEFINNLMNFMKKSAWEASRKKRIEKYKQKIALIKSSKIRNIKNVLKN